MNIKQLNKEIINLYHNKNKKIYMDKQNEKIYITDSYAVWIISEKDFIFDTNKFKTVNIKSIIDDVESKTLLNGIKTGEYHKDKSITSVIIKSEELSVQINEKYLKLFNENCTFKVVNDNTPVLVYENDELVGMVCPIKTY